MFLSQLFLSFAVVCQWEIYIFQSRYSFETHHNQSNHRQYVEERVTENSPPGQKDHLQITTQTTVKYITHEDTLYTEYDL